MIRSLSVILCLAACPALADGERVPLTGDDFADRVTGRTLLFAQGGEPFGAEYFAEDRSVTWSTLNGQCSTGYWTAVDTSICFLYDHIPNQPQCWNFYDVDGVIGAELISPNPFEDLLSIGELSEPMQCDPEGQPA